MADDDGALYQRLPAYLMGTGMRTLLEESEDAYARVTKVTVDATREAAVVEFDNGTRLYGRHFWVHEEDI